MLINVAVTRRLHQLIHQPRRTTANIHDTSSDEICLFAGIFENGRTTKALWICLRKAEVTSRVSSGPLLKSLLLQVKREAHTKAKDRCWGLVQQPFSNP